MLFGWMSKLVAAVPDDQKPDLSPMEKGETLLEVPEDFLKAYRASMWASREADLIKERHAQEHEEASLRGERIAKDVCAKAHEEADSLAAKAAALGAAVIVAVKDHCGLMDVDTIYLRTEGLVQLPRPIVRYLDEDDEPVGMGVLARIFDLGLRK